MELSEFAFRVLLLFFPGLLCAFLVDALTVHRRRDWVPTLLHAFAYGMSSYFLYGVFLWLASGKLNSYFGWALPAVPNFFSLIDDPKGKLSFTEIGAVSLAALVLGIFVSVCSTYKIPFKVAGFFKITRKTGELDVWGHAMNLPDVEYATVRDFKNDLMYDGWIQGFSDDAAACELLLRDVAVYRNTTGELLYSVGSVYLSLEQRGYSVEFRQVALSEEFAESLKIYEHAEAHAETDTASTSLLGNDKEGRSQSEALRAAPATTAPSTPGEVEVARKLNENGETIV